MNGVTAHLIGIHSRSKKHVSASRDFDRGRISSEEYLNIQKEEASALAAEQKNEGFAFVSDGQFLWQDLLRPFAESPRMKIGALTRWFETNTFYKKPIAEENWAEGFDARVLEKYFVWQCNPSIAFLPGPFSLHKLSENVSIGQASLALGKANAFLAGRGIGRIVFSEPSLGYRSDSITAGEWKEVHKAFESVCATAKTESIVHVYYGSCSRRVFTLPVAGIAVDLFEEQNLVGLPENKILGLGAVDSTNTLLETKEEVAERAKKALSQAQRGGRFFLCPNQAFDYISRPFAKQKIGVLTEAARLF